MGLSGGGGGTVRTNVPGRRGAASLIVGLVVLIGGCGSSSHSTAVTSGLATTVVTAAPASTTAATAAATTTTITTAVTTTQPATTVAVAATTTTPAPTTVMTTVPATAQAPTTAATVPTPIAPPADSRGQEPQIDLGSIEIPRIGLSASLFEGIRLTTLDRGPGHWPGTAMPGAPGNVVVAGHRTSHSKPFRHLEQLVPGDEVIFTTVDGRFVYDVVETEIVTPDTIRIIDQTSEQTATLFACHPVGSTRERIVVHLALATT